MITFWCSRCDRSIIVVIVLMTIKQDVVYDCNNRYCYNYWIKHNSFGFWSCCMLEWQIASPIFNHFLKLVLSVFWINKILEMTAVFESTQFN